MAAEFCMVWMFFVRAFFIRQIILPYRIKRGLQGCAPCKEEDIGMRIKYPMHINV